MRVLNEISLEVKSIAENVALARVTVAAFAAQLEYTLEDLDDIKVAVSEAVSNAIIHGYANKADYMVGIKAAILEGNVMEVEIKDNGVGISDVEQAMQPAYSTADRTGLGFSFMQSMMDEVRVDSAPGEGTVVRLLKKAPGGAFDKGKNN